MSSAQLILVGWGRRVLIVTEEPPDLNKAFDDVRAWT